MKILSKTALSISTLITISACSSNVNPTQTQLQGNNSFSTKGFGNYLANNLSNNSSSGQDSYGRYTSSFGVQKLYSCYFNSPSWYDWYRGIPKCDFTCYPVPKTNTTNKVQTSKPKYVYDL